MPILATCQCGKRMRVPDEYAGKRVKCPKCGQPVTVPAPQPAPAQDGAYDLAVDPDDALAPPAAPSPAAPPSAPSAPMSAADELAASLAELAPPSATTPGGQAPGRQAPAKSARAKSAPAKPASATAPPPAKGGRTCSACGAPMSASAAICTACGFMPARGIYVPGAKRDASEPRYVGQTGSSMGNFLGVNITPVKLVIVLILLAGVIGGGYWWFTGPGKKVAVVNASTVDAYIALDHITQLVPVDLSNRGMTEGRGNPDVGYLVPKGMTPPAGAKVVTGDVYGINSNEKLVVVMPRPTGQYLLVQLELSQGYMQKHGLDMQYDLMLKDDKFEIRTSKGKIKPIMLTTAHANAFKIELDNSSCAKFQPLVPPNAEPARKDLTRDDGGFRGWVEFDGKDGVDGRVEFAMGPAGGLGHNQAAGVTANGKIAVTDKAGMDLNYNYFGDTMAVTWPAGATGWFGPSYYKIKPDISPFKKWPVALLFDRAEAGSGKVDILIDGSLAASVNVNPSGSSAPAAPTTSAPAAALPADFNAPPPAAPANPAANNATPSADATARPGEKLPKTGYLGTLAAARQQAKGLAAMSNVRQLALAVTIYRNQHGGKFPESIDDLEPLLDGYKELMVNPRTGQTPGFIYVKPPAGADAEKTPIIYEAANGKPDPRGAVGYLDGHAAFTK